MNFYQQSAAPKKELPRDHGPQPLSPYYATARMGIPFE